MHQNTQLPQRTATGKSRYYWAHSEGKHLSTAGRTEQRESSINISGPYVLRSVIKRGQHLPMVQLRGFNQTDNENDPNDSRWRDDELKADMKGRGAKNPGMWDNIQGNEDDESITPIGYGWNDENRDILDPELPNWSWRASSSNHVERSLLPYKLHLSPGGAVEGRANA